MTVTGWLGWTPEVALTTPLQQINLAMEGKIDFLKKTNPWGSKDEEEEQDLMKRAPDPEGAARGLLALVQRKGAIVIPKKGS